MKKFACAFAILAALAVASMAQAMQEGGSGMSVDTSARQSDQPGGGRSIWQVVKDAFKGGRNVFSGSPCGNCASDRGNSSRKGYGDRAPGGSWNGSSKDR